MKTSTMLAIVGAFAALAACGNNNSAANNAEMNADMNAGSAEMNTTDMNSTTDMNAVGNSDMNATAGMNESGNAMANNAM